MHVDIVRSIVRAPQGLTREQVAEMTKLPRSLVMRRLEDMEQLQIVKRVKPEKKGAHVGTVPHLWFLTEAVNILWRESIVDISPRANGQG